MIGGGLDFAILGGGCEILNFFFFILLKHTFFFFFAFSRMQTKHCKMKIFSIKYFACKIFSVKYFACKIFYVETNRALVFLNSMINSLSYLTL